MIIVIIIDIDSTSLAGVDFTNTSFTIIIPPSESERGLYTIPLPDVFVIDDDINETVRALHLLLR